MKVHNFISSLDDARQGNRRVNEDTAPVASSPDHAPTSTAQWKTPSSGKSKDEGERTGGEKDAIKKSDHSIPAPVAKAPSHAPTSTAQWKTKDGKSEDEGQKINKEAVKEANTRLINRLISGDEDDADVAALITLGEGGHKPGCKCGFCANMGKLKKKGGHSEEPGDEEEDKKEPMGEAFARPSGFGHKHVDYQAMLRKPNPSAMPQRGASTAAGSRPPLPRPGGANLGKPGRMGFRHPSAAPRPKAAMDMNMPAMERLNTSSNPKRTIQELADRYLPAPGE